MNNDTESTPTYRIRDLAETDRPRERLSKVGAAGLSTPELLAILLRTGLKGENAVQVGQRLLKAFGGVTGIHRASFEEICKQKGVGVAKAAQIKAAMELGHRMSLEQRDLSEIHSPDDAVALVGYEMRYLEQEELRVILLDIRNRLIKVVNLYKGSLNSSQVRIAEIFREAIRLNAATILVLHNHPSGDPSPSVEDISLTRALVQTGQLLDLPILDHIIIGGSKHVSLKERKAGFP